MPTLGATGAVSNEFFVNDLIAAQEVPGQARVEWALDPLQRRSTYEEFAWVNDAWASSVNDVRLALGAMLEIGPEGLDQLPAGHPMAGHLDVYQWLTVLQEYLVLSLMGSR